MVDERPSPLYTKRTLLLWLHNSYEVFITITNPMLHQG